MQRRASTSRNGVRMAATMLLAFLAVLAAGAALALPANAEVWTAPAGARIFPSTKAGTAQAISLSAAGNEYEGVQIGVRGMYRRSVSAAWLPGSDPLLVKNSRLHEVKFVRTKKSTGGLHAHVGYYPDPIIPRDFGKTFPMGSGRETPYSIGKMRSGSLYLLVHAPYGTPAGTYGGWLRVTNGDEITDLPVSLRVYSFGWQQLSTKTAFVLSVPALGRSISSSGISFSKQNRQRIVLAAFRMLQEHGVAPLMLDALPKVKADGSVNLDSYLAAVLPYLSSGGLNLPTFQLPWCSWFPYQSWRRTPYSPSMVNYLATMCRFYRDNGWQDRFYGFYMDEPLGRAEERTVEAMARTLHRASAQVGYRAKFMVTDDPRPKKLHPILPANKYLWDDVDIWCVRYYYFFGRIPVLRKLRAQGREVWWYTYTNGKVREMPNFVIEKTTADQRVWGWLMQRWNVDGLLYWGVNRWGEPKSGKYWRDPYRDPLSYVTRSGQLCNGEASIIYPGYYPRYGLTDPYAAPVSSLRLEALRDGLEDREYLRIAMSAAGPATRARINSSVRTITWYNHRIRYGHVFTYPGYKTAPAAYMTQRDQIAQLIEQGGAK